MCCARVQSLNLGINGAEATGGMRRRAAGLMLLEMQYDSLAPLSRSDGAAHGRPDGFAAHARRRVGGVETAADEGKGQCQRKAQMHGALQTF